LIEVSPENYILIGRVIRPHGLNGFLRIHSYAGSEESFLMAGTVLLKLGQMEISEYKVLSIKAHGNAFLIKLNEISSLEAAEKYRGAEILIRKDTLRHKNEDEYFWFELIGLEVFLNSGRFIGILQDIINTGSNDIYVVKEGKKEILIPALHGIVLKVDLDNKKMLIADNIDGLLDINEV
jgi:16S rRNA processing protein RimM